MTADGQLLSLRGVSKSFGRVVVAQDLDLSVRRGEALGIVGPNGAGKSSLFSMISGDLRPDGGTVWLDGTDVTGSTAFSRTRAGIGRTYQVPRPFEHLTVFENVLVCAHQGGRLKGAEAYRTAAEVLERTGLATRANEPAGRLGLLARKRLEVARALGTGPQLLLLDEVAGGLTEPEVAELVEVVSRLREDGLAIVWIEHVVHALVKTVERMICLAGGRVVADGAPLDVLADPEVRELYMGSGPETAETPETVERQEGRHVSLLSVTGLDVHHGQLHAVRGVDLEVERGQVLAVIGANGAGKSTLLRALAGSNVPTAGTIVFDGRDVTRMPAHRRVAAGIALVPEGRKLFRSLSVEENLLTGTYAKRSGPWTVAAVYDLFPWMGERRRQNASQLSGGEQQSVAIGRALVSNPELLLIDELSLGLAPVIVQRIYQVLPTIVAGGTTALIVEQDVSQAMRVADHVHCLLEGRSVLEGSPRSLTAQQIERAYFGISHTPATED